jgi:hypothetical protein
MSFFFMLSIPVSPAAAARRVVGNGTEVAAAMSPVERALAARIAADHNSVRAAAGLDPLREFDALAPYAGGNGQAMRTSGELQHSEIGTLLDNFAENMWAAENSLVMFDPASDAVGHWMQSGPHAANMMAPRATHLWVDVRCATDGRMWVTTQFVNRAASGSEPMPGLDPKIAAAASSDLRCPVAVGPFASADDFVAQQYADFLGRPADAAGHGYWSALLNTQTATPSEVVLAFLNSAEFSGRIRPQAEAGLLQSPEFPTPSQVDQWRRMPPPQALVVDADIVRAQVDVFMIYVGMLDRTPDTAGFEYWTGLASEGVPLNALVGGFLDSAEYSSRVS